VKGKVEEIEKREGDGGVKGWLRKKGYGEGGRVGRGKGKRREGGRGCIKGGNKEGGVNGMR
jgi:hypothetical protein